VILVWNLVDDRWMIAYVIANWISLDVKAMGSVFVFSSWALFHGVIPRLLGACWPGDMTSIVAFRRVSGVLPFTFWLGAFCFLLGRCDKKPIGYSLIVVKYMPAIEGRSL